MPPLLFATHNQHKVDEVRAILGDEIPVISLNDIEFNKELPETHDTLKENAFEKAEFVHKKTGRDCFAEDTGLEIEVLGGEPGVRTARYAGPGKNSIDNIQLILQKLADNSNRKATFRTVIACISKDNTIFFEGKITGSISPKMSGIKGFGYDPVFIPEGYNKTFAELDASIKNAISHRAKAFEDFKAYLQKFNSK